MKILIVDDHAILRKGLLSIVRREFIDCTCFEATNGIGAISILENNEIDIVLSDISMPDLNGIEMLKQIKTLKINTPALILSMLPEDQYAIRVIKAGAFGFISKNCDPKIIIEAIKTVLSGKKYITSSLSNLMIEAMGVKQSEDQHDLLSDREMQVLKQVTRGKTLSEIANDIGLSVNTVSTYKSRIFKKLNIKTNSALIRYAIDNKLDLT